MSCLRARNRGGRSRRPAVGAGSLRRRVGVMEASLDWASVKERNSALVAESMPGCRVLNLCDPEEDEVETLEIKRPYLREHLSIEWPAPVACPAVNSDAFCSCGIETSVERSGGFTRNMEDSGAQMD